TQQQPKEVDELLAVDVVARDPVVDGLVVVGAVRPEDVQPLAATAHAHQEALADQQPATIHQVQAPDGVTRIDVVAARQRGAWAFRLALVPCYPLDEGTLLVRVRLPQQAAHLGVADGDPPEQVLHPAGRVADAEGVLKPLTDLLGAAEAAGFDLVLELADLLGGELARVALVVQGTQGVEPLVAIDAKPFAQLAEADPQQAGDLFP